MVNYNNGKIYKIEPINGEEGDVYIGSTTNDYLSKRMCSHRSIYKILLKNELSKKLLIDNNKKCNNTRCSILFEKYGVDNCNIILIENVNASSSDELRAREAFYIQSMNCVNKNIPLRTQKQYNIDNKERYKIYREANREEIKERNRKNSLKYLVNSHHKK
jgi:hypothetical protein